MENTKNFNDITALSKSWKQTFLDIELNVMIIRTNIELDDDLQKSLKDGTYQFQTLYRRKLNVVDSNKSAKPVFNEIHIREHRIFPGLIL